ncbi:hypothetical protein B0T21DRAFT_378191 [Apiosordaria backusii]|uniref:Uncharacterized protein n=1 Tax=Apiosordaria backusii TaxID=314023 RepID=A0AA39ZSL4_9PEZI|nr:hypothetical protein B0T21DRAFT_378191 [Apiosordaria backusii]
MVWDHRTLSARIAFLRGHHMGWAFYIPCSIFALSFHCSSLSPERQDWNLVEGTKAIYFFFFRRITFILIVEEVMSVRVLVIGFRMMRDGCWKI